MFGKATFMSLMPPFRIGFLSILILPFVFLSCSSGSADPTDSKGKEGHHAGRADNDTAKGSKEEQERPEPPLAVEEGKIYEKNGRKYLWGGEDSSTHFDITNCSLKDSNFHYGLGREHFEALVDPEYISVKKAGPHYDAEDPFLLVRMGEDPHAYPLGLLKRHEVVNDRLGGKPVFAAYCYLADLAAVYPRTLEGDTFTFALSGYTYYDPEKWNGKDAFVLWDRQTESLWWPLRKKAVSGEMKGTPLEVYDESKWERAKWERIQEEFPDARILKKGQVYEEG
jgi:hypothetical protein